MEKKTIDQILIELVDVMDNPLGSKLDKKFESEVFNTIRGSEGFTEYLRETLGQDMKRYFAASSESARDQIKGHFSFAVYLLGSIAKAGDADKLKEELSGKRQDLH